MNIYLLHCQAAMVYRFKCSSVQACNSTISKSKQLQYDILQAQSVAE